MINREVTSLFVLRRAFLVGRCRRADVNRAFDCESSPNVASALMKHAVHRYQNLLYAAPHRGIAPKDGVACPVEAQAETILKLLAHGASSQETGLFPDDSAPFLLPKNHPAMPIQRGAADLILQAALNDFPLRILYVGMRINESARWRNVWPRAMEFTGSQWQVHAQDMDDQAGGYPIKVFLLPRILEVQRAQEKIPKSFPIKTIPKTNLAYRVHFSDALTPDQSLALKQEFHVQDGILKLPQHAVYTFLQNYTEQAQNRNIVWPPISRLDPMK